MSALQLLLLVALSPLWLLYPLYLLGIQWERARKGGWHRLWYLVLPFTARAFVVDVALNYTLLAIYLRSWPRKGEFTFTKHLERLLLDPGWRGHAAWFIEIVMLGWADPDGYHASKPKEGKCIWLSQLLTLSRALPPRPSWP